MYIIIIVISPCIYEMLKYSISCCAHADVIMDMLGNPRFRQVLTEYYQDSKEPKLVRYAVKVARWKEYSQSSSSMDSLGSALEFALFGAKKVGIDILLLVSMVL